MSKLRAGPSTVDRRLLILTAVTLEAKAVAAALGLPCPSPVRATRATIEGAAIEIHVIGIAAAGLDNVRLDHAPTAVVMAGLAGALDPALSVGDVVVEGWPTEWPLPANCRVGRIHSMNLIVPTPQQKAELFASSGALAVEMENAAVSAWADRQWGPTVPLIAIRAISDRADQSLDPAVMRLVNQFGQPRVLPLVRMLFTRPRLVRHLMRLGADSRRASKNMADVVKESVNLTMNAKISGTKGGVELKVTRTFNH